MKNRWHRSNESKNRPVLQSGIFSELQVVFRLKGWDGVENTLPFMGARGPSRSDAALLVVRASCSQPTRGLVASAGTCVAASVTRAQRQSWEGAPASLKSKHRHNPNTSLLSRVTQQLQLNVLISSIFAGFLCAASFMVASH